MRGFVRYGRKTFCMIQCKQTHMMEILVCFVKFSPFKVIWEQIFKNQNRVKFRIFLNVQIWEMVCGVVGKAFFMI